MSNLVRMMTAAVVLAAGAAFAHPFAHPASPVQVAYAPQLTGHYETRNTERWVPGHWTMAEVPLCRPGVFRFRCHGRRMEQRFIPGHFETVAEQVWVNDPVYGLSYQYPPSAQLTATVAVPSVEFSARF